MKTKTKTEQIEMLLRIEKAALIAGDYILADVARHERLLLLA